MKKLLILALTILPFTGFSQTLSDVGRLSINAVQPQKDGISSEAIQLIDSKLKQIITSNGIADNGINNRFILTAIVNVVSKDIVPSNPPRVSQKLDVTFVVADIMSNKAYETKTITLQGLGISETKAMISAFNNIKPTSKDFSDFIGAAKEKIVSYYASNCDIILKSAQIMAENQKFDEAIYTLCQVPDVCRDCYDKCQSEASSIFVQKINAGGLVLLNKANARWSQEQTYQSASDIAQLIAQINPYAQCQEHIQQLLKTISAKLRLDEKKDWDLMIQKYNDDKNREQRDFDFLAEKHRDGVAINERELQLETEQQAIQANLREQEIQANKEVALEYAKSIGKIELPKTINFN